VDRKRRKRSRVGKLLMDPRVAFAAALAVAALTLLWLPA
jgi:hypothetical protein